MAAKLRPRVMLPRPVSTSAAARLKPAAVSFSGLLDGRRLQQHCQEKATYDGYDDSDDDLAGIAAQQ